MSDQQFVLYMCYTVWPEILAGRYFGGLLRIYMSFGGIYFGG